MSETYAVQVNPSIGGVLWNIRGATAEEFKSTITFLGENASDIQDALAIIQQQGLANQAAAVVPNPVNAGTSPPGNTDSVPTCEHGPMNDFGQAGSRKKNKKGEEYRNRYYCSKFGSSCSPRD